MLGIRNLPLFIAGGLLLNMLPGPDTLYILGRNAAQGKRAGALSALGISSGCLVHAFAAAFGLSAALAASASAFTAIKLIGAIYLTYLGARMWLDRKEDMTGPDLGFPRQSGWAIYRQGALTNILNPKVALFFLSFLPQFVDPASPTKVAAFLALGLVFIFNGTMWRLLVAWFAAALSGRLRKSDSLGVALKRAVGTLFIGLGVKLAVSKRS